MTDKDQRQHTRFDPQGLTAHVTLEDASESQMFVSGEVIDMSHSGIRLKLESPLPAKMNDKITIHLTLPESGIPFSISGIIKHKLSDSEYGLRYESPPSRNEYDDIVLECFKLT